MLLPTRESMRNIILLTQEMDGFKLSFNGELVDDGIG